MAPSKRSTVASSNAVNRVTVALVACARKLLIFAKTVVARGTPWTEPTAEA